MIQFCYSVFSSQSQLASTESKRFSSKDEFSTFLLTTPKTNINFVRVGDIIKWTHISTLHHSFWDRIIFNWKFTREFSEWGDIINFGGFKNKQVTFYEWLSYVYPTCTLPKKQMYKKVQLILIEAPKEVLKRELAQFKIPNLDVIIAGDTIKFDVYLVIQKYLPGLSKSNLDIITNALVSYEKKSWDVEASKRIERENKEILEHNQLEDKRFQMELERWNQLYSSCKDAYSLWQQQHVYSKVESVEIASRLF